ncbi:MAG: T9SS type A sorting domain-containing protein [Ignavibacteria bacterium]
MKRKVRNTTIILIVISGILAIATRYGGTENHSFVPGYYNDVLQSTTPIQARMPSPSETILGHPWNGRKGITETIDEIMDRERKHPFVYTGPHLTREESEEFYHGKMQNPTAPDVPSWPPVSRDNIFLKNKETSNPQTIGVTFDGPQLSESGFIPPDNNGDVGPAQILVIANGRVKVFDKTGVLGALNTTTDNFFSTVRNGSGTSDPHIRYDRLTQRWFITMINVATPNRILIAVSSGSTISGSSSFTFYFFQHDMVGTTPNSDTGGFADYDTFGLDKYALYIGVNVFNAAGNAVLGTTGFVINKSSIIAGTLTVTPFRQLTNGSNTGPWTPQGVNNDDPSATEGYFIGVDFMVYSQLDIRRVTNPGGTPSISGNITLTVPSTYAPISQPALGTSTTLDALDDRLFAAHLHKNKVTGTQSLWTAHNIRVNSSGVGTSSGNRNGGRWYEIANLTGTPSLNQSGTLYDTSSSGNPRGFWIPGVAMNGQGHMTLGCSTAGANLRAEIAASGRLFTDILGLTQSYTLAQSSSFAYNITVTNPQRWGDFSQVNIDPNDDMTMWTIQEYCNAANSWCERVIQLKAPPPATPTSATSVTMGLPSVNTIVTGTSSSGSGFFDPGFDPGGPGYSSHLNATVSGGVVVNNITFNSSTQVTLNLNTTGSTAGFKNVTITNPDGQIITGTGILQVTSPLPVSMYAFNYTIHDRDVFLGWTTTYEINNSGFEIDRIDNNTNTWEKIGFVAGKGNSNSQNNYSFKDASLNTGSYQYKLKQIDYNGNFEFFNLSNAVNIGSPNIFGLSQNYPNPSNPVSKIDYQLPAAGHTKLALYELTGKEIRVLIDEQQQAGYYSVRFDGTSLASGVYYYRIIYTGESNSYSKTLKLVLIK